MAELDAAEWWVLAARSPFKTPRSHAGENPATATNNIVGGESEVMVQIAMIAIIIVGALLGILAQSCGIVSPPAFWTIGAVTGLVAMGVGLCFR